ncbi:MAG: heavy metal-associated domain-containing protein [Patescibacteria group bacterium]
MTATLQITGMHCVSCKALIEDVCSEFAGVTSCAVDVAAGRAIIGHDGSADMQAVVGEINRLGKYRASIV